MCGATVVTIQVFTTEITVASDVVLYVNNCPIRCNYIQLIYVCKLYIVASCWTIFIDERALECKIDFVLLANFTEIG